MTFLYSSVHSECFSYIDYVFDEGTSCKACNNETEVTVINPVLIMVDWAIDDVLDNISSVIIYNPMFQGAEQPGEDDYTGSTHIFNTSWQW